jgi:hypothetical protein
MGCCRRNPQAVSIGAASPNRTPSEPSRDVIKVRDRHWVSKRWRLDFDHMLRRPIASAALLGE